MNHSTLQNSGPASHAGNVDVEPSRLDGDSTLSIRGVSGKPPGNTHEGVEPASFGRTTHRGGSPTGELTHSTVPIPVRGVESESGESDRLVDQVIDSLRNPDTSRALNHPATSRATHLGDFHGQVVDFDQAAAEIAGFGPPRLIGTADELGTYLVGYLPTAPWARWLVGGVLAIGAGLVLVAIGKAVLP